MRIAAGPKGDTCLTGREIILDSYGDARPTTVNLLSDCCAWEFFAVRHHLALGKHSTEGIRNLILR